MGLTEYGHGRAWIRVSYIGEGSFGRVYKAILQNRSSSLPPEMAVKSVDASFSAPIRREREVYRNIGGDCPYIIECYGEEITRGPGYGIMAYNLRLEYASGRTLAGRIKREGGLSEVEARLHTRSILRGLKHIHDLGYVHCDLKPDNILLIPDYWGGFRAKIGDLGLAKKAKQDKKGKLKGRWEGTPMYLSPEAVVDGVQEAPSDVWAVGCIVFEMLTGKSPLKGKMERTRAVEVLRKIGEGDERVEIPNELSKKAKAFLKGCFARNSKLRLTCEMLLQHSFLEEEEEEEESETESDDESNIECSLTEDEEDCLSSRRRSEEVDSCCSSDREDDQVVLHLDLREGIF